MGFLLTHRTLILRQYLIGEMIVTWKTIGREKETRHYQACWLSWLKIRIPVLLIMAMLTLNTKTSRPLF
ncbi:hypothetical protein ES708_34642 [subsurface metagenome]